MTTSPKKQLLVWGIGGSVLVLALAWVNFFPLRQKLTAQRTNILDARVAMELNVRQQQNLSALKQQVDQTLSNTQALNRAFFDRTKTLAFLEYVEGLAEKEKLTLTEPQVVEPARTSPDTATTFSIEEKPFSFNLTGPMPNLMRFLRAVETNEAYLLITTVDLQENLDGNNSLSIQGAIPWH